MKSTRDIAEEIVVREGGYVNDPDDPGGPTKFGVTLATLRRLGLDLTKDGIVNLGDVQALSRDQAIEIFLRHYFYAPSIDELPDALQATVFDMYVNAGRNAVKLLQRLLGDMGFDLAVDGRIGPVTISAAQSAARISGDTLRDAYGIARRNYYFSLADRRPQSRKYARTQRGGKGGWIKRAEAFLSERYHMSQEEFDRRVAQWG